jgi:hypothetical protein
MPAASLYETWLRRIIVAGIGIDVLAGLALLIRPDAMSALVGVSQQPSFFVRLSGLWLVAFALASLQAGLNPSRNPLLLAAIILVRLLAALFFLAALVVLGAPVLWAALAVAALLFALPLWLAAKAFRARLDEKP